jgi:hypothetical protein
VKRLYLVGTSKDGKKLVFAQKKGAKFGSLEMPISPKLVKIIGELVASREAKRKAASPEAEAATDAPRAPSAAERELARSPSEPVVVAVDADEGEEAPSAIGLVPSDQIDIPVHEPPPEEQGKEEPLPGINAANQGHPSVGLKDPDADLPEAEVAKIERIRPRTEKPEIPAKSKLSPAEIQTLIRGGRGIRSVANLAGTPVDWVRYLAEPIQEERRGIVRQMLTRRQERARLGLSGSTVGEAIMENLRSRGIRAPEVVIDEGFTAFRPDGREWRVRLVFDHRGRRQTASWSFDAQTRAVTPLNSLATSLGWRRAPGQDVEDGTPAPRPRRSSSRARSAKASGRKRTTRKRKTAVRKKTTRRRSRR